MGGWNRRRDGGLEGAVGGHAAGCRGRGDGGAGGGGEEFVFYCGGEEEGDGGRS